MQALSDAPFSQEAEEAVIGAVLTNPAMFPIIAGFLADDDFFLLRHKYIWQAMKHVTDQGDTLDLIPVTNALEVRGQLKEIGGMAYLTQVISSTPTSMHAEVYGKLVKRAAVRRRAMRLADEIKAMALDETQSLETFMADVEQRYAEWTLASEDKPDVTLRDQVKEYLDRIETATANPAGARLFKLGFHDLDAMINVDSEDLVIGAGRPSMGKTAFWLALMLNMITQGKKPGFISLEQPARQILQRVQTMRTGIQFKRQTDGELEGWEYSQLLGSMKNLIDSPDGNNMILPIEDKAIMTPDQVRRRAMLWKRQYGLDALFIDYLQLLSVPHLDKSANETAKVSYLSTWAKQLARELKVPVFILSQLNRALESRSNKRPIMSDLRQSGQLEQDADVILFLYRDVVYNEDTEFPNEAEIIVAKSRNGATGTVQLYYESSAMLFMDGTVRRIDFTS